MAGPRSFRFLNQFGTIENAAGWSGTQFSELWLFNLHYFDDLNAEGWRDRAGWHRHLLARWIAENPPGRGIAWEPYPLSRRIVNWIKWALGGNDLNDQTLQSLAIQARYLSGRIEWHLLGNHLLANALALVFAGLFFEGREADAWRAKGLEILASELPEQVLPDGGHFELSPMYHGIVLSDLLDLINLAGAFAGTVPQGVVEGWKSDTAAMRHWLAAMSHPDGQIAFFNDAAFGAAATGQIEAYAQRLGLPNSVAATEPVAHLRDSGYLRVALGEMVAFLDVGEIGPDYQPGHAHADTLSFEVSLFGQRVLVNSGTSRYGVGPERSRQRSTAAHNTVEVNAQDSSQVWAGFRVARRARPFDLQLDRSPEAVHVGCAHDGYRRLPGRVVHRREWTSTPLSLQVTDRIQGRFSGAVARYHVHPDVTVESNGNEGRLILPNGGSVAWHTAGANARVVSSRYHPEFGLSTPNSCIEVVATEPGFSMTLAWS